MSTVTTTMLESREAALIRLVDQARTTDVRLYQDRADGRFYASSRSQPGTFHRGARLGSEPGMSWSTDRDVAAWFARRFHDMGTPAVLMSTTIAPDAILGAFDGRNEHEVLINPAGIDEGAIRVIDAASPEVLAGFERRISRGHPSWTKPVWWHPINPCLLRFICFLLDLCKAIRDIELRFGINASGDAPEQCAGCL